MMPWRPFAEVLLVLSLAACAPAPIQAGATTRPAGKLPHVQVDVRAKQIRVDCQMLGVEVPVGFLCVLDGTNEHESVLGGKGEGR